MIVLGLCGLPAGGKSAVAAMLQQLGAVWVNADRIAHQVLQISEVSEQLARQFGSAILSPEGKIDRPRLATIVFGDDASAEAALRYLESVVHPLIRERMVREIARALRDDAAVIVLDAPLLLESQWDLWCDEIWYIDTAEAIRVAAAADRGWTAQTLQRRTARQLHVDEKRRLSSVVIHNHGTLEQLRLQIATRWPQLIEEDRPAGASGHCRDRLLGSEQP